MLLPATLAAEAGGRKRFELEAGTVGDALRQLPVAGLLFDEAGELRRLINVYVNGVDARGGRLLDEPLTGDSEVRIVGAVAGGEGNTWPMRACGSEPLTPQRRTSRMRSATSYALTRRPRYMSR